MRVQFKNIPNTHFFTCLRAGIPGFNTVSLTNGGTECFASLSHTKPKLENNCELDDLETGFEIMERYRIRHGFKR